MRIKRKMVEDGTVALRDLTAGDLFTLTTDPSVIYMWICSPVGRYQAVNIRTGIHFYLAEDLPLRVRRVNGIFIEE